MQSLHRHALESVCGFLTLAELSRMLAAARIFAPPIVSMRPINAALTRTRGVHWAPSALWRHIVRVAPLANDKSLINMGAPLISSLCTLLPNLRVLGCDLDGFDSESEAAEFQFPPRLTELQLRLQSGVVVGDAQGALTAKTSNVVLRAAGSLIHLTKLSLTLPPSAANDYSPLHALPALRDLELQCGRVWTPAQLDQLRAMPHLHSMVNGCSDESLGQLLRTPHQLRWTRVSNYMGLDPANCGMLTSLPSLEWLACGAMCKVDFLHALPALRYLDLRLYGCLSTPPELAAALQSLPRLTELRLLGARLNDDELAATLSVMPLLESLCFTDLNRLRTLSALTVGSVPRTLRSLKLQSFKREVDELLPYLLELRSLTNLSLYAMLVNAGDAALLAPLRVPSTHLPHLLTSSITAEKS